MRRFALLSAVGLFVAACGCGSKPDEKETVVTGTVTLDGKTLTMGEVYFETEDGSASGAGEIGTDGTFRVPSAPLGKVKAAVRTSNHAQYASQRTLGGNAITMGGREGTYVPVPKKYEDIGSSGLSFTLTKDAKIDIPLTSK